MVSPFRLAQDMCAGRLLEHPPRLLRIDKAACATTPGFVPAVGPFKTAFSDDKRRASPRRGCARCIVPKASADYPFAGRRLRVSRFAL